MIDEIRRRRGGRVMVGKKGRKIERNVQRVTNASEIRCLCLNQVSSLKDLLHSCQTEAHRRYFRLGTAIIWKFRMNYTLGKSYRAGRRLNAGVWGRQAKISRETERSNYGYHSLEWRTYSLWKMRRSELMKARFCAERIFETVPGHDILELRLRRCLTIIGTMR